METTATEELLEVVTSVIVAAVSHRELLARPLPDLLSKIVKRGCFVDVKSQFDHIALREAGLTVWRL